MNAVAPCFAIAWKFDSLAYCLSAETSATSKFWAVVSSNTGNTGLSFVFRS